MADPESLFSQVGGMIQIRRVHKIFYDKIYEHAWLGKFFEGIDQEHIENQQSDFMSKTLGGPSVYCGAAPVHAHKRMMITDALFDVRAQLLADSLREAGVPPEAAKQWLGRDAAFRQRLTKRSVTECEPRFRSDTILNFPPPAGRQVG